MNTLVWRRRWYYARPWVKDAFAGVALIAFMIASFWAMDAAAAFCQAIGWCA